MAGQAAVGGVDWEGPFWGSEKCCASSSFYSLSSTPGYFAPKAGEDGSQTTLVDLGRARLLQVASMMRFGVSRWCAGFAALLGAVEGIVWSRFLGFEGAVRVG